MNRSPLETAHRRVLERSRAARGEREEEEFARFQEILKVSQEAPDFEATRLEDGEKVRLSDYTAHSNVVLEFGSFT